jgi:hypothetical protein
MKHLALTAALFSSFGFAQTLNCESLKNSSGAEPAGYVQQCLGGVAPAQGPSNGPLPNVPTDLAVALDIRGNAAATPPRPANTAYSFVLNNFPVQTALGAAPNSLFAIDSTPDGLTAFAVSGTGATAPTPPLTLFSANLTTSTITQLAAVTGLTAGDNPTGLAINPVSGAALLSAVGGATPSSRLYSLNLNTGVATLIGPITAPTDPAGTIMIDISMNCQGELFGHNISDDALYQINPATGAGTARATHGLAANFAQGMDFDNSDGTLYAFIYTGAGTNRFGTFNLTTGAFTALATDNPLGEYEGFVPNRCPVGAGPQITLSKRVQLANASTTCAAAGTSVTLPFGGGTVDYCYTVTNTGSTPLITHTLVDPAFSTPVLSNFAFTLNIGAAAFVRQPITITRTQSTPATWSACNQANNCAGAQTASATVPAGVAVAGVADVAVNALNHWGLGLALLSVGALALVAVRRYA